MTITTLLNELAQKLSPDSQAELHRLAGTPEFQAIVDRDEDALREKRRAWIARLETAPNASAKEQARANARRDAAAQRMRELELQMFDARAEHSYAFGEAATIDRNTQREVADMQMTLRETADPRLDTMRQHCTYLEGLLNISGWSLPYVTGHEYITRRPMVTVESNATEVSAALAVVREARADAEAMKLIDLSRDEVKARLDGHLLNIAAMLAPLHLDRAALMFDEHGNLVRVSTDLIHVIVNDALLAAGAPGDAKLDDPENARTSVRRTKAEAPRHILADAPSAALAWNSLQ